MIGFLKFAVADAAFVECLCIGAVFLVLAGSMIMPALAYASKGVPLLVIGAFRRAGNLILDKIVESAIICSLSVIGGLWLLELLPVACR